MEIRRRQRKVVLGIPWYAVGCYTRAMKVGVSLPDELIAFADREAERLGTSRSGLLAQLLRAEQLREQTRRYLDKHGWDVVEDEESWRNYQRRRMGDEYGADEW